MDLCGDGVVGGHFDLWRLRPTGLRGGRRWGLVALRGPDAGAEWCSGGIPRCRSKILVVGALEALRIISYGFGSWTLHLVHPARDECLIILQKTDQKVFINL